MSAPSRVVVLGVGNLVMSDEGLGVHCAQRLQAAALPPGVSVIDGGTSTHELLGELENLDLLVIVDAVATSDAPGSVVRIEADQIPSAFSNNLSPHQHGINDLLAALRLLGRSPARAVLLGVTPARIELGLDLSPEIAAMMPVLVERVIDEVTGKRGASSASAVTEGA